VFCSRARQVVWVEIWVENLTYGESVAIGSGCWREVLRRAIRSNNANSSVGLDDNPAERVIRRRPVVTRKNAYGPLLVSW